VKEIVKTIIENASNASKFTIPKPENKFREGMLVKYQVDVDKVAEAMIQECINTLTVNGYDDAADVIKKTFEEDVRPTRKVKK
jgi:hypothetical protein